MPDEPQNPNPARSDPNDHPEIAAARINAKATIVAAILATILAAVLGTIGYFVTNARRHDRDRSEISPASTLPAAWPTTSAASGGSTSTSVTGITLEITEIPPGGGGDIRGRITGLSQPQTEARIVLYAYTNHWHIQPFKNAPFTDLNATGEWSGWTHPGERFAALLVRRTYQPGLEIQSLPGIGGEVLAKMEVPAR